MKERLDQYTMSQFIDIACGDYSPIDADSETSKHVAGSLIEKYNELAEPIAAKTRLLEAEKVCKNEIRVKLYSILLNLIYVYQAYDDVRDILITAKSDNVAAIADDLRLVAKIEQLLRTEKSLRERMLKERQEGVRKDVSEDEIRASFDRQTARLMSHFKFAISHRNISASVYASLVDMACRQQRQQASK